MAHGKSFIPSAGPAYDTFFKNICQYVNTMCSGASRTSSRPFTWRTWGSPCRRHPDPHREARHPAGVPHHGKGHPASGGGVPGRGERLPGPALRHERGGGVLAHFGHAAGKARGPDPHGTCHPHPPPAALSGGGPGKRVYVAMQWQNESGVRGDFTDMQSTIVP